MTSRYSQLTEEAAKIMLKRSLAKSSDEGFIFTSDQRLKARLTSLLNEEQQLQVCATFVDMKYKQNFIDNQF
jgi:hypothetical protein